MLWCRKCRRFSKTFLRESEVAVRKEQNIGLLWAKVRMFCPKTTDVFIEEVRWFCFPEREQSKLAPSYAKQAIEEDEVKGSRRRPLFGLSQSTVSSPHFQMLKKICRTATTRNVDRKRIHTQTAQEKTLRKGHRLRPDSPPSMPPSRQISAKSWRA